MTIRAIEMNILAKYVRNLPINKNKHNDKIMTPFKIPTSLIFEKYCLRTRNIIRIAIIKERILKILLK